mgnify:CR=1 FL=1
MSLNQAKKILNRLGIDFSNLSNYDVINVAKRETDPNRDI